MKTAILLFVKPDQEYRDEAPKRRILDVLPEAAGPSGAIELLSPDPVRLLVLHPDCYDAAQALASVKARVGDSLDVVYVALHKNGPSFNHRSELLLQIQQGLGPTRLVSGEYSRLLVYPPVWPAFCRLLHKLESGNDAVGEFDDLRAAIDRTPRLGAYADLRHRIESHLFSALVMDLERLEELGGRDRLEHAAAMIAEVRQTWHPYLGLWADLVYLLCGKREIVVDDVSVAARLDPNVLPKDEQGSLVSIARILELPEQGDAVRDMIYGCGPERRVDPRCPGPDAKAPRFLLALDRAVKLGSAERFVAAVMRTPVRGHATTSGREFVKWFMDFSEMLGRLHLLIESPLP